MTYNRGRRTFIKTMGAGAVGAIAGCTGGDSTDGVGQTDTAPRETGQDPTPVETSSQSDGGGDSKATVSQGDTWPMAGFDVHNSFNNPAVDGNLQSIEQQWVWEPSLESEKEVVGATLGPNNLFVMFDDGSLHAVNRDNGETNWTYSPSFDAELTFAYPPVDGNGVYYSTSWSGQRVTVALDRDTGEEKWLLDGSMFAAWMVHEEMLFGSPLDESQGLIAVNTKNGSVLWEREDIIVANSVMSGGSIFSIGWDTSQGQSEFPRDEPPAYLFAKNLSDGSDLWQMEFGGWVPQGGMHLEEGLCAVFLSDVYYGPPSRQKLVVVDLSSQTVQWSKEASFSGGSAVADGRLFLQEEGFFKAYEIGDGTEIWSVDSDRGAVYPLVAGEMGVGTYISDGGGDNVFLFDPNTGDIDNEFVDAETVPVRWVIVVPGEMFRLAGSPSYAFKYTF